MLLTCANLSACSADATLGDGWWYESKETWARLLSDWKPNLRMTTPKMSTIWHHSSFVGCVRGTHGGTWGRRCCHCNFLGPIGSVLGYHCNSWNRRKHCVFVSQVGPKIKPSRWPSVRSSHFLYGGVSFQAHWPANHCWYSAFVRPIISLKVLLFTHRWSRPC